MRILYLHQYFNTPQTAGSTRSYEMARRLVADGHEVIMLTSAASLGQSWAPSGGWRDYEVDGIKLKVLSVSYSNAMPFARRIKAFLHFAFGAAWHVRKFKTDVVFATSTPLTIIIPGLAAKFWHRIPLVFEVRDLWPELPIAVGALRTPVLRWAARALEWIAYHAAAHVVALSPGMAEGVMRRGIPAAKVTVIPNSCDVDLFDVPSERGDRVREQLGLAPQQPLIVYTGSFGLVNGVDYLVDVALAMRRIAPHVRFLLVGKGAKYDAVRLQAERAGVLDETLWVWPALPKEQVPDLLAAATLATSLVVPLKPMWNNSANKVFDAFAAGKPIAINYEGWQADLLRREKAGVVIPPDEPDEAARILADFVYDPARLHEASIAARKLAYEVFNRDLLYLQLAQVLRDVVGDKAQDDKKPLLLRKHG